MRTVLASALLAAASQAALAHEGHGETGLHWHGGDVLPLLAMVAAVCLWLWRRSRR